MAQSRKNFTSFIHLLSTMRFAITMLCFIGIASVIGTILKQNEPYENYIIKFGQFWFEFFEAIGLYNVYQAFWFLLILIFLIISTSFCVSRNSPKILKEYKKFQLNARERSLKSFKHSYEIPVKKFNTSKLEKLLTENKFRLKKQTNKNGDLIISAKKGDLQKLGYIFTHLAIIIISIGGLMDGNLVLKMQELTGSKKIIYEDLALNDVPETGKLTNSNFSYRAQMLLREGEKQSVAVLKAKEGYFIQDLPFIVGLNDFRIEHYSTGQPKSFESDLIVEDKETGELIKKTINVNTPLTFNGITIYQSSFEDGGTELALDVWNLHSAEETSKMESIIFKKNELVVNNQNYFFEFNDFRKFNILDIEIGNEKKPTNVGPSFIYKVRNESGQAKEYQTYQYPMMIDNSSYFVSGMRKTPQEDYQYLKLPADANGEINGFMIFRELLHSPQILNNAIKRVVAQSFPEGGEKSQIYFEGVDRVLSGFIEGGYSQIAESIDTTLPIEDQERIANSYIKIIFLVGKELITIYELNNIEADNFLFESNHKFVQESLTGFNDSFFYGLPIFLELKNYVHVQSSGLQLTKSPGQFWVYLGSILLVLGIFCMIYIQEVRLWILKKKDNEDILLALTTNRHRLEFDQFALKISQLMKKTFN